MSVMLLYGVIYENTWMKKKFAGVLSGTSPGLEKCAPPLCSNRYSGLRNMKTSGYR
jgi:hypothetical protein